MNHVTDAEIQLYYLHKMKQDEERGFLEHIAVCEYCAGRWASGFPKQEMLTPPNGLRENIRRQTYGKQSPQKRKAQYREWYWYSAKVVLAMSLAIVMLFGSDFSGMLTEGEHTQMSTVHQTREYRNENKVSGQIRQQTEKFGGVIKGWSESIGRSLRGEDQS